MVGVKTDNGRACIEGVRRVTWDTGEFCEFASALVSAMEALGEKIPYHYVMGTSGTAFRFTVSRNIWEPGSFSINAVSADPAAAIRRAFQAIGRGYTLREMSSQQADAETIMDSIHRGVPVLAFGVVGPSDVSLITGYDDGGGTLLGWSTYQDIPDDHNIPHDATGYFRKPDWYQNTRGYILIEGKTQPWPPREVYLDSLRWAVALARQSQVREMPAGLGAYNLVAQALRQDKWFPTGDTRALGGPYLGILCILMMVDDHAAAVDYLRQIAGEEPDLAPDLLAAADCYQQACALRARLRDILKEDFADESIRQMADAGLRREYATVILDIRDCDEKAIGHIEQCLARL